MSFVLVCHALTQRLLMIINDSKQNLMETAILVSTRDSMHITSVSSEGPGRIRAYGAHLQQLWM